MSDFKGKTEKVAGDVSAVMEIIKLVAYPIVFVAGLVVGLLF